MNQLDLNEEHLDFIVYITHYSQQLMGACVSPQDKKTQTIQKTEQKILCNICIVDIPKSQTLMLTCGHTFGKDCLIQAFTIKIRERNLDVRCPDCSLAVEYDVIGKVVAAETFVLYDKTCLVNSLILDENIFFCPTVDCPGIYDIIPSEFRYFQCRFCLKAFCLICHKQYHGKTDCVVDDVDTPEGSLACINTKCRKPCVKVSGCNLVNCLICKTSFCFECKGTSCGHNRCVNKNNKLA